MDYNKSVPSFSIIIMDNVNYTYKEVLSTTVEKEIEKGIIIESKVVLPTFSSEKLEETDLIIEGKVININTAKKINNVKDIIIYRDVVIAVTNTVKGSNVPTIIVRRLGGTIVNELDNNMQLLTNEPHFHIGEMVKLYLDMVESDFENYYILKDYGKWVRNYQGVYINTSILGQEYKRKSS